MGAEAPAAAPPAPRRRAAAWGLAAAAVLLLPGLLERVGAVQDDEAARLPALFLLLAAALPWPASAPRTTAGARALVALALLLGLPIALHPASPLSLSGAPWLFAALAATVLLAARRLADAREADAAVDALALATAAAAAWILVERVLGRPAVGPFGRAGVAGPALAALLPFSAAAAGRRGRPVLTALAAALPVAAAAATGSRTGTVAALCALGVLAGLGAPGRRRTVVLALTAAGFAVFVGIAAWAGLGLAGGTPLLGRSDTLRVRAGLVSASLALVREEPLRGHGPYGFASHVLETRDLEEARISAGRRPLAAHDDPLHFAAEGGIGAGVAVVALLGLAFATALRRVRAADGAGRARAAAAAAAVVGVAVAALGEDPLLAAPTVAVLGVAAGLGAASAKGPAEAGRGGYVARSIAALALLALAALHVVPLFATAATRLYDGSFRASEAARSGAYEVAASLARRGRFGPAREAYGRLLAWDPGATEARLDVAETYRLEGRVDDARATLEEARRHDPTRFDVPHRLGHLRLGDEVPPSKRVRLEDPLAVLRLYNEAAALAPGRFETRVAYARVHRWSGDLASAGRELRAATESARRHGLGLPCEILLESFRLAEAEGASRRDALGILQAALVAGGPAVAAEVRREADAALDAGEALAGAAGPAKPPSAQGPPPPGKADFEAATVRYAGLVSSGRVNSASVRAAAREAAAAGRDRRALALYVALVADPFADLDTDLVLEARAVAARVDRDAADALTARARTLLGFEALAHRDDAGAERHFRAALARDAAPLSALYGLARALARQGKDGEAIESLGRALDLDPSLVTRAAAEPDLAGILRRLPPPKAPPGGR